MNRQSPEPKCVRHAWFAFTLCLLGVTVVSAAGSQPPVKGRYLLESQIVLPHLDQMRQQWETSAVCGKTGDFTRFFPVFAQPAMIGCTLQPLGEAPKHANRWLFKLVCSGNNGAAGHAHIELTGGRLRGEIHAKMGGKNMTFAQYFKATHDGECQSPGDIAAP